MTVEAKSDMLSGSDYNSERERNGFRYRARGGARAKDGNRAAKQKGRRRSHCFLFGGKARGKLKKLVALKSQWGAPAESKKWRSEEKILERKIQWGGK